MRNVFFNGAEYQVYKGEHPGTHQVAIFRGTKPTNGYRWDTYGYPQEEDEA